MKLKSGLRNTVMSVLLLAINLKVIHLFQDLSARVKMKSFVMVNHHQMMY